jgi:hypothetical protein
MMVDVTSNPSLEPMAKEARRRLERAVAAVVDG